ncbi:MAG: DUF1905 domain-containing protein [Microthrixaceae bacterium]
MDEPLGPFFFTGELWEWDGPAAWHFVSLPADLADLVAEVRPRVGAGFGSVRVEVTVAGTTWQTSLFPDSARGTYLLPVKAAIRRAAGLVDGSPVEVELTLR